MAVLVLDTSALVKRYINEPGSAWVRNLCDPLTAHQIFLVRITRVEMTAAVIRRGKGGALSRSSVSAILALFRWDVTNHYNTIQISTTLLSDAERLAETHALRAYDAVQLAGALAIDHLRAIMGLSSVKLITADRELYHAALSEGIAVDDPNLHP